jgi:hypothetical protein
MARTYQLPESSTRTGDDVVTPPAPVTTWRSRLVIDQSHPFYFDHPLDHVPGIMMITALMGLVRAIGAQPAPGHGAGGDAVAQPGWTRISLWFPRFCELDRDTELQACPSATAGAWTVLAAQPPGPVCLGTVALLDADPLANRKEVSAYETTPSLETIPGYLVHRIRAENILLGKVRREKNGPVRAAILSPRTTDHLFAVRGGGARTPEELIEAARQAAVMLWPYAHGWPADVKLTLNSLTAELPVQLDRSTPLEVRWWPTPIRGKSARTSFEVVAGMSNPELAGLITITMQAWSGAEWDELRSARK